MFKQYINGQLIDGDGKVMEVTNPADGSVVDTFKAATAKQAIDALEAAQKAFKTWSKTTVGERIALLRKFRAALIDEKEHVLDLLMAESGKPYTTAEADFNWCMESFDFYSEEVMRVNGTTFQQPDQYHGKSYHIVEHRPIGVVVGHVAWNYPLGNAGLKIGPSVVSGCTLVLKPSSQTPLATLYCGEVAKRVGFPDGILNIIAGPAGELGDALNTSTIPRMITLIGSSDTGRQIMRDGATSIKSYSLELGGNSPVIVMDDADVELAAANTVSMKSSNTGQMCTDYNRIFVHEKIYDKYCELVLEGAKKIRVGSMRDDEKGFVMGPMISRKSRDEMIALTKDAVDKGAKLLLGGGIPKNVPESGNFFELTVLVDVPDTARVFQQEIFGPIIAIQKFNDLDKTLEKAVDTPFGLTSYLYSHDSRVISKCFETFESGEVEVNGAHGGSNMPHVGIKESGVGCDSSRWSLMEYYNLKRMDINP